MKKLALILSLLLLASILVGCELTISKTTTEYDKKTNTIKRTTTILPDLEKDLSELFGK